MFGVSIGCITTDLAYRMVLHCFAAHVSCSCSCTNELVINGLDADGASVHAITLHAIRLSYVPCPSLPSYLSLVASLGLPLVIVV